MASRDLRSWMGKLETEGELKRIKARVDWDGEIPEIIKKVLEKRGPAILFENIKDYENTWCTKMFSGGLASRKRLALMMGMPKDTSHSELAQMLRKRFKEPVPPKQVDTGPVKENIIKGNDVDLFQIPTPKWHPLDGGRYIITWGGIVTMDPDSGEHNVGLYRGMIISKNKIGVLLVPAQDWGKHYSKYQQMGQPMPVAVFFGGDPSFAFVASQSVITEEYGVIGAIMQEPVSLVKCETSGLMVPAEAEIVVEGSISPDPNTYEIEGPFGEWTGFYGMEGKRPVIKVDCITFRNDPIYRGSFEGMRIGLVNEDAFVGHLGRSALMWDILGSQGIPGILDIVPAPTTVVKIHKTYQGQAKHIAAALWGSKIAVSGVKTVMVVEEEVDIHNLRALELALQTYVDPAKDVIVFPMGIGGHLDISVSSENRDEIRFGAGLQNKLLIDATIDWTAHPIREAWGNRRIPPTCTGSPPELEELVQKRWKEYGFEG
ncbi:UbiD family decarboxylase [Chloroflexota bacterium]